MKIVVLCWLLSWSLWIVSVPCNLRNCSAWWVSIRLGCLVGWSQENPTFTRVCIPPLACYIGPRGVGSESAISVPETRILHISSCQTKTKNEKKIHILNLQSVGSEPPPPHVSHILNCKWNFIKKEKIFSLLFPVLRARMQMFGLITLILSKSQLVWTLIKIQQKLFKSIWFGCW